MSNPNKNSPSPFQNISTICNCDVTVSYCDYQCCCDNDCITNFPYLVTNWTNYGQCITNKYFLYELFSSFCVGSITTPAITDLQSPLGFFTAGFKAGFCLFQSNAPTNLTQLSSKLDITSTSFNSSIYNLFNVTQYNNLNYFQNFPVNKSISTLYDSSFANLNLTNLTNVNFNYSDYDPMIFVYPALNRVSTMKIPFAITTGICEFTDSIKFLRNQNVVCGRKFTLGTNDCSNYNSIYNFDQNLRVYLNNSYYLTPEIHFFNTDFYTSNEINSTQGIPFSNQTSNTCSNMIRKVEYIVMVNGTNITGMIINYYLNTLATSQTVSYLSNNYVVQFMNNYNNTFVKSGNPGYIKGNNLITGNRGSILVFNNQTGQNQTAFYINQFKNARLLTGFDSVGRCTYSSNPYNISNIAIQQANLSYQTNYMFENTLTLENKIQFGCFDQLSNNDLISYCNNNQWVNKFLFQDLNSKLFTYLSSFGNPNTSKINDWISLAKLDFSTFSSTWDSIYLKCNVPAIISINLIYSNFGAINNSQLGIDYAEITLNYMDWYANSNPNPNSFNKYYTYFELNLWTYPQNTSYWYAPAPNIIPKFPKNYMYPFKIGTTVYSNSNRIKNILISYLIFAFLIISLRI